MGGLSLQIQEIDYKVMKCDGNPFQSSFWAAVKKPSGWKPQAFSVVMTVDGTSYDPRTILVLTRTFSPGMSLAYIPFGPDVSHLPISESEYLKELSKELKKRLPRGVFALRYDLPWSGLDSVVSMSIDGRRFRTCQDSVQPEGTVRLDLSAGYAAVSRQYRERARRNVRKAESMVKVETWNGSRSDFDAWYAVYLETAHRDGFSVRNEQYLRRMLAFSGKLAGDVDCTMYLARYKGRIVGGCINLETKTTAIYLFGASLRMEECSCSYAIQDYAIRTACERGCQVYDLHGIPGLKGRGDHLRGLDLFKRSFGGNAYYRTPSTDYLFRPLAWKLFSSGEKLRYRLHRRSMSPLLQSSGSNES